MHLVGKHTSLDRYWPKSPFPSNSSLHSSKGPREGAIRGGTFSFLSIRWKDTSRIVLATSSLIRPKIFFFSLSTWLELCMPPTASPSPPGLAAAFGFVSRSLSNAYKTEQRSSKCLGGFYYSIDGRTGKDRCWRISHTSQKIIASK